MSNKRIRKKKAKRAAEKAKLRAELSRKIRAELIGEMGLTTEQAVEVEKLIKSDQQAQDQIDAQLDQETEQAVTEEMVEAKQSPASPMPGPPVVDSGDEDEFVSPMDLPPVSLPPVQAAATASIPATAARAPMASKITNKARGIFFSMGGFASRVFGMAPTLTTEEKQVRGEILKINNQLILTKKIIESNGGDLAELAKIDKSVADLLKTLKSDEIKKIEEIQQAILEGKDVSKEDTTKLIESLEHVTSRLDESKVSLEARFSDIAGHFESLITNDDLDRADRRSMIEELVKIGKSSDIQAQLSDQQKASLAELEKIGESNLNFTADQKRDLKRVLTTLSDAEIDKAKLRGTLNDLNQTMDAAVLTSEDLKKKLSEKQDSGKTLKESALAGGIKGIAKTGLAGTLDYLLGSVGLGGFGLGDIIAEGALPFLGKGVGKLAGLAGRGGVSLFKGIGGFGGGLLAEGGSLVLGGLTGSIGAGGLLKGGAKLLGKAALPIAAVMSLYDAYRGWDSADEIAGTKPGMATMGQKVQAGVSSALSGLTFGLVDTKTVYGGIERGLDFLFGEDGLLGKTDSFLMKMSKLTPLGLVYSLFERITGGAGKIFGPDGVFATAVEWLTEAPGKFLASLEETLGTPSEWAEKLTRVFSSIGDVLFGEEGLFSLKTVKKALRFVVTALPGGSYLIDKVLGPKDITNVPANAVSPQTASVNTRAVDLAVEDSKLEREQRAASLAATRANKPIPVVIPPQQPQKKTVDRSPGVDDIGLAVMNHGMAGI